MSLGFEFFEVSALQSKGLAEPFTALANTYHAKYEERVNMLMQV